MEIDLPDAVAEVTAAFERYEQALMANDVEALGASFRDDPRTIRYGIAENLYGFAEIAAFRAARSPVGLQRTRERTVITTFDRDFAVASTLFRRNSALGKGRPPDADLGAHAGRLARGRRACERDRRVGRRARIRCVPCRVLRGSTLRASHLRMTKIGAWQASNAVMLRWPPPISGVPDIGSVNCASRLQPTCVAALEARDTPFLFRPRASPAPPAVISHGSCKRPCPCRR